MVIVLFGDFSILQHSSSLLPGAEHLVKLRSVLVMARINKLGNIPILFLDFQAVSVFQREQGMHEPHIGINVRYGQGME